MRMPLVVALGLAACGGGSALPDGVPLLSSATLVIAAAPGDELVVAEPDVIEAAQHGGLTVVYVIDGDTSGVQKAYAAAAGTGATGWLCGWLVEGSGTVEHCRNDDAKLSLVFVGYPANSLLDLWEGTIDSAKSKLARATLYDQPTLIATVAAIVTDTKPSAIRTLEIAATHGMDESDHMLVGALALLATAAAGSNAELVAYRGDNIAGEPVNQAGAFVTEVSPIAALAFGTGPLDGDRSAWLQRRYAAGFRRGAAGALDTAGQCVTITSDNGLVLGGCSGPPWQLDAQGALKNGAQCLSVLPTGELVLGTCDAPARFFFDDEGRIWASIAPAPAPNMDYAHLTCLTPGGGRVRAVLCGQPGATTWTFDPVSATTARAGLGLASSGRALQIGDLTGDGHGDLCAVEAGGLLCAAGDGTGQFAAATRIDSAAQPLAIDPRSLALGDVDHDGRADACGLASDGSGILCALAARDYAAGTWSTAITGAQAASLAIVGSSVCALASSGMTCATDNDAAPVVLSASPVGAQLAWPGELDGDGQADWCATSPTTAGVACGVAAEAAVTTDGVPWSWSLADVVDPAPASADVGALADIDGDGRADLCVLDGAVVACGRSQGRRFGPRTTLATFAGTTPTALVLGDLDGDGHADACVDTGTAIACALSP
ncbi:MAG TPA: VCBS repeat-containing protein [Kofleriaceae bacterium]|nr:VCBS repeat-containing protein [Kofleriaceae bacterium]